ncbi:2-keto-4-pentenoate hydratase [Desulfitibacter alkalitolerans]|uniref:2-keto-4-pentenoate hydratase n=1 Tax=Desulfitibacter alkalitolerans TaxID=264641 RepID=UPI00047F59E1|nr:fumarylacetoacetate hydrolase family protein [Desulfitibacter alkalitolerans]
MEKTIKKISDKIYYAEKNHQFIEPISIVCSNIGINEAYGIQFNNVKRKVAEGEIVIGKKVGLTNRKAQEKLGFNGPVFGYLFNSMNASEEAYIDMTELIRPKLEVEMAFLLKKDLRGPGITISHVLQAAEGIFPAFEIVDSRYVGWKGNIMDIIADNVCAAKIALGENIIPINFVNLKYLGVVLEKNGKICKFGTGAAVLGQPALAVAWLANKMAEFNLSLKAGEIILSGALFEPIEINTNDIYQATMGDYSNVRKVFK